LDAVKLVLVEWVDSAGGGGWQNVDKAKSDAAENELRCETAGWLLERTDRYVLVATSRTVGRSEDDQVGDPMQIPAACVTRIRTLDQGSTLRR